jgi:hypothetical protein
LLSFAESVTAGNGLYEESSLNFVFTCFARQFPTRTVSVALDFGK